MEFVQVLLVTLIFICRTGKGQSKLLYVEVYCTCYLANLRFRPINEFVSAAISSFVRYRDPDNMNYSKISDLL